MATIALVVGLAIGIGAGWVAKPAEVITGPGVTATATTTKTVTVTPPAAGGLSGEVKIGWVDGLTGGNAFWGEQAKTTADIALEEVNKHLKDTNAGWTMTLVVEDSETKPDIALEKLKSLHARGITIVSGWGTSGDLRASMTYANTNKILLLSYGSTAIDLAVAGDYVYRLMPTSAQEGQMLVSLAKYLGVTYLIPLWRGDSWGDSVVNATRTSAAKAGISVDDGIRYNPDAVEFSAEASALNSAVLSAKSRYGADKVAWFIVCFEEGKAIYEALAAYNPTSWGIKWLTNDGPSLCDWVVGSTTIAEMVSTTDCIFPAKMPTPSGKMQQVQNEVKARLGRTADLYGLNGYDCVWTLALALMAADKYDPDAVRAQLPMVFDVYQGAGGWSPLNEYGDRSGRNFGLYKVMKIGGEWKWVQVGMWDFGTEEISWLPEPVVVY
jgi:branched-chain amino acid transport system substrate-binding protein